MPSVLTFLVDGTRHIAGEHNITYVANQVHVFQVEPNVVTMLVPMSGAMSLNEMNGIHKHQKRG